MINVLNIDHIRKVYLLSIMLSVVCLCTVEKLLSMCSSSCLPGGGSNTELALHCLHHCQGNTMVSMKRILVLSFYFFFLTHFIINPSIHCDSFPCVITHLLILLSFLSSFSLIRVQLIVLRSTACLICLFCASSVPPSVPCRPHWRCCCSHSRRPQETTTTLVTFDLWIHSRVDI